MATPASPRWRLRSDRPGSGAWVRRRLVPQLPSGRVRPHRRAARPRGAARPGAGDERASRSEGVREAPRVRRPAGRAVVPVGAALAPRAGLGGVGEGDGGVQPGVSPHQARRRFAAARVARLATADVAGRPHIVPVTFAVDGDIVYSAVDAKPKRRIALKRLANVAVNPAVALLVDHYADDWNELWWVRAEAPVAWSTQRTPRAYTPCPCSPTATPASPRAGPYSLSTSAAGRVGQRRPRPTMAEMALLVDAPGKASERSGECLLGAVQRTHASVSYWPTRAQCDWSGRRLIAPAEQDVRYGWTRHR